MFMNQSEIKAAHSNQHTCPNVRKDVQLLYRLMQAVNSRSLSAEDLERVITPIRRDLSRSAESDF